MQQRKGKVMVRFYGKNLTLILPFSYLFNISCILIYYNILYIKKEYTLPILPFSEAPYTFSSRSEPRSRLFT